MKFAFLALIIFVAGFIDAIAGGGGLLTLPAYLLIGVPADLALGTNKLVSATGTLFSTGRYFFSKRIVWNVCAVGAFFSLLGSTCAAKWVGEFQPATIAKFILVLLPIAALLILLPKKKINYASQHNKTHLFLLTPLITFTLGAYDGGFGPGTGTLLVFALYGLLHLSMLQAAATARVFNLLSNLAALGTFMFLGKVNYQLALPLCIFGIAGHWCGAHTALKKGDHFIRQMLMFSAGLLFVALVLKYLI